MTVLFHAPYGAKNPETGLLYLMANYLRANGIAAVQLQCNGAFALCDRDANRNWTRSVASCLSCMREQRQFAHWAGLPIAQLSMYLTPEVIEASARWSSEIPAAQLRSAACDGIGLFDLVRGTFHNRFGVDPDPKNKSHERFLRSLLLWASRFISTLPRIDEHLSPEIFCVPFGDDVFALSVLRWTAERGGRCASFRADFAKRSVTVKIQGGESEYHCPLLIDDLTSLRNDPSTWTGELGTILGELSSYLGLVTAPVIAEAV